MSNVAVARLTRLEDVVALAARIDDARPPVRLDLSQLDELGSVGRTFPIEAALVTNLLLGAYGDLPIEDLVLPAGDAPRAQLYRAGLPPLLGRRIGLVPLADDRDSVWDRDWIPGDQGSLLPEIVAPEAAEKLFVFVNTHRQPVGYFQDLADRQAAMPWLGDLLPVPDDRRAREDRRHFISAVTQSVVQLLDNQGRHAFRGRGHLEGRRPWLGPKVSYVAVALTKGGGAKSWNRLHILAFDNGYGITRTLRWAHPELDLPAGELVQTVLERRYSERGIGGHNGIGLWWLHDLCRTQPKSHLTVVTEDDQDPSGRGAVLISSDASSGSGWRVAPEPVEGLPIRGAVVSAVVQVPMHAGPSRPRRLIPADQPELVAVG